MHNICKNIRMAITKVVLDELLKEYHESDDMIPIDSLT
jgi:hypothetical protein